MDIKLHAIVDIHGEPYEETCLCDGCYTDYHKDWYGMSHDGKHSRWREFDAPKKNTEYSKLVCTICGFPIGSEMPNT